MGQLERELFNPKDNRIISDKVSSNTKTIWTGRVVLVDDDLDGRSIRVRIKGLDDKIKNDSDLPFAYPFESKLLDVTPKIGEAVRIILPDVKYPYSERLWIGPILSKYQKFKEDKFFTALDGIDGVGFDNLYDPISKKPSAKNIYPKIEDVNIHGRDNSDLVLKENEFVLRANKHIKDNPEEETTNPSYIQGKGDVNEDDSISSTLNLIADSINLISHNGSLKVNPFLTEKDLKNLTNNAHPIPKGDVLISLLKLLINVTLTHSHSYSGQPLIKTAESNQLGEFNLENILNKFIKVN